MTTTQSTTGTVAETGGSRRLGLALVLIATAQLMVVLDATIVNVALPHIQHALGFSGTSLEWVASSLRAQAAAATARATRPSQAVATAMYHHALASGFSRAFLGGAVIMLLALVITVVAIRIRRADLTGAPGPANEPHAATADAEVAADIRP